MRIWLLGWVLWSTTAAYAEVTDNPVALVTMAEAARADAPVHQTRGLFPGPLIKLAAPTADAADRPLISPFHLQFEFFPRNAAKVDLSSIKLIYLKSPSIDLTPRVLSSISTSGIDLNRVSLPPGRHTFLVSVLDTNGSRGAATYTLTVAK